MITNAAAKKPIAELVTTKQLAEQIGVSELTIWRWRERGLPFKRLGPTGRSIRFDLDEVNEWILSQGQQ
jgi:excisionase family DNA binding protein